MNEKNIRETIITYFKRFIFLNIPFFIMVFFLYIFYVSLDQENIITYIDNKLEITFSKVLLIILFVYNLFYIITDYYLASIIRISGNDENIKEEDISDIFNDGIKVLKSVFLIILVKIKILLWFFVFVIPGIIKYYSYSFSMFIFLDNKEKGISNSIKESCKLTKGYKTKLMLIDFVLSLIISIIFGNLIGYLISEDSAILMLILFAFSLFTKKTLMFIISFLIYKEAIEKIS